MLDDGSKDIVAVDVDLELTLGSVMLPELMELGKTEGRSQALLQGSMSCPENVSSSMRSEDLRFPTDMAFPVELKYERRTSCRWSLNGVCLALLRKESWNRSCLTDISAWSRIQASYKRLCKSVTLSFRSVLMQLLCMSSRISVTTRSSASMLL